MARDSCESCGSGQYVLNASSCEYCEFGKYAPVALQDACLVCAAGSATGADLAATTCTDCSPGKSYALSSQPPLYPEARECIKSKRFYPAVSEARDVILFGVLFFSAAKLSET
jgi:hypothetical protein